MPLKLKDWCTPRRLLGRRWQFVTNRVRDGRQREAFTAKQKTKPTPSHRASFLFLICPEQKTFEGAFQQKFCARNYTTVNTTDTKPGDMVAVDVSSVR